MGVRRFLWTKFWTYQGISLRLTGALRTIRTENLGSIVRETLAQLHKGDGVDLVWDLCRNPTQRVDLVQCREVLAHIFRLQRTLALVDSRKLGGVSIVAELALHIRRDGEGRVVLGTHPCVV